MNRIAAAALLAAGLACVTSQVAAAAPNGPACAGFASLGGAELVCSQAEAEAPAQSCVFSWALITTANVTQVVQGSFSLPPRATNMGVYQGSGFSSAASNPIIFCHAVRTQPAQ